MNAKDYARHRLGVLRGTAALLTQELTRFLESAQRIDQQIAQGIGPLDVDWLPNSTDLGTRMARLAFEKGMFDGARHAWEHESREPCVQGEAKRVEDAVAETLGQLAIEDIIR